MFNSLDHDLFLEALVSTLTLGWNSRCCLKPLYRRPTSSSVGRPIASICTSWCCISKKTLFVRLNEVWASERSQNKDPPTRIGNILTVHQVWVQKCPFSGILSIFRSRYWIERLHMVGEILSSEDTLSSCMRDGSSSAPRILDDRSLSEETDRGFGSVPSTNMPLILLNC